MSLRLRRILERAFVHQFASRRSRRREGIGREWKRERDWGKRVGKACYKNPLLFISANAGVRKFLIGWAVMSNLLACIVACMRQTWCRPRQMCSSGIRFGRSKLLPSCSNFTLKPELEPTVTACFSRQRCSGGFVYWICPNTERRFKAITILAKHLQCRYSQACFFRKNIYRHEWTF